MALAALPIATSRADVTAFAWRRGEFHLRAVEEIPTGAPVGLAGLEGWKVWGPGYGQTAQTNPHLICYSGLTMLGAVNPSYPFTFGPGAHEFVQVVDNWHLRPGAALEEDSGYRSTLRVINTTGTQSQYRLTIDLWATLTVGGALVGPGGSASWSIAATPGYTIDGQTTYLPGIDLNATLPTPFASVQSAPTRIEVVIGRGPLGTGPEMVEAHIDFRYEFRAAAIPGAGVGPLLIAAAMLGSTARRRPPQHPPEKIPR